MKQRIFRWALLLLSVLVISTTQASKKVWMLGDSTMTQYDDSEPTGGRGWGMYFGNFLVNGWSHVNLAQGGRDSRGGYTDQWLKNKNDVEAGDYVIIQFAHNDAAVGGIDYNELVQFYTDKGDTEGLAAVKAIGRGTQPSTTYKDMLKLICDEVRAKGATPILVTAVCRHGFSSGKVTRAAKHDIGGNYDAIVNNEHVKGLSISEDDHTYDYPYQMKAVADAEGVAFLDMTTATANLMEQYEAQGSGNCFAVMFDKKQTTGNDGTHYNVTGALLAAQLCAQLILDSSDEKLAELKENVYVPTDMSFNPSVADMGDVYTGQVAAKEVSLSALGLDPAEGGVTITSSEGIQLSFDKVSWSDQLTTDYAMGTLIKTFYVRVPVNQTGNFQGTVEASIDDTSKTVTLDVTATGIELGGGDPFTATWDLSSNATPEVTEGVSVTANDALYSSLVANGYDSTNGAQVAEGDGGAWNAARIDNISTEYAEFSITAPEGRKIDISNIYMKIKENGGDNLHFHIKSSTDDFATETSLAGFQAASATWTEYNKGVNISLDEGETLKLRIYPWSDAITTGNVLCIKDVVITGQSKDANGVNISGTITYAFDKGGLTQQNDVVMNPASLAGGIAYKKWKAGAGLTVEGTTSYIGASSEENITQTKIVAPSGTASTAGKDNTLSLTLMPDYGYSFVPTKVSFKAARYGTSGGRVGLSLAAGDDEPVKIIGDGTETNLNGSGTSTTIASFEETVTASITATADKPLKVNFSMLAVGSGKTIGISDIVIEGTLVGAPESVTKYLLTTSVEPADAGTIEMEPEMEMYKAGSAVQLTASANRGFLFKEWQDASGATVTTDATTTVTMDAAKTMKAVYETTFVGVMLPNEGENFDLDLATMTSGSVKTVSDVKQFDSVSNGGTATFNLINNQDGARYFVNLGAATNNSGVTLRLVVTDNTTSTVELDETISVDKDGWQTFNSYTAITDLMSAGEKTFVIHFLSGSGYTANVNNINFTAVVGDVYTLTAESNPAEGGKVTPAKGTYTDGTNVQLTATANPYFVFQKWDDESTNASRTVTMPEEDKTVTAYFVASPLTIPTIDTNPFKTEWAECSNCEWNGTNINNCRNGATATYTITNTKDCSYILKYQAATAIDGAQVKMQIKQGSNVVWEETKDVENTDAWQTYKDYEMNTTALTQGEYTFVVNFSSSSTYTCNVKDIQFKADVPIVAGQMLTLSVDGVAMGESVLNPLVAEGHAATLAQTFTSKPTIVATFDGIDGNIIMSNVEPTIEGNTLTYVKNVAGTDYTFTFTGYHPYTMGESDETVEIKYQSSGRQSDGTWTNGLYTLASCGDGWDNSSFKMGEGDYTWSVPSDVKVKQIILHDFNANYGPGSLTSCTSEGATVYVPFKHDYQEPDDTKYDLIINLENHTAGTPITFNLQGGGQPVAWFEFTIEHVDAGTAPVVKNSSVTVKNNHAVVAITFDREMQTTIATVGEQSITAEGGSATLYFSAWDLDWNQIHTLTIAAGEAQDRFGNANAEAITADIEVEAQPAVEQQTYDYVVGTVDELLAAINAVNSSNTSADAARKTIFVKNGTYELPQTWHEGDSYKHDIKLECYNVSIIGQSKEGVLITAMSKGITSSTLDMGNGTGNYLDNLTIRNSADFRRFNTDGSLNLAGVCVAVSGGNHAVLKRVAMQSNQDTYVTGDRTYLTECDIHGTVDFICGGGDIFFDKCNLILENRDGDVIVAPSTSTLTRWGYVMNQCTIDAAPEATLVIDKSYGLGRPWQNEPRATYLYTTMKVLPNDNGWNGMGNLPTYFYEYNSMNADGSAIDLSVRGNSATSTNHYTPVLTDAEALKFNVENVLGGTDSWLPTDYTSEVDAPMVSLSGSTLSWTAVDGARCYVIFKNGKYLANQTTTSYEMADEGIYTVRAANEMGGLGAASATKVFKRSITAGNWSTIVVPFAVGNVEATFGTGTKVAQLTGVSGTTLQFSNVTSMNANEPYMIKVANDFNAAAINGATLVEGTPAKTVGSVTFQGVYTAGNIPAGAFFVSGNQLYRASDATNTIKPFRAYFVSDSNASALTLDFGDGTTGINTLNVERGTVNGEVYNLASQRVMQPTKGLYIVNGKKVIVK